MKPRPLRRTGRARSDLLAPPGRRTPGGCSGPGLSYRSCVVQTSPLGRSAGSLRRVRRSVGALIPGVRPTPPVDRRRLQPPPAGLSVAPAGLGSPASRARKHATATAVDALAGARPWVMELGEVRGEGRVLEQPVVEPSVGATERPGVGPAAVRADGAGRRAVRRRAQLGRRRGGAGRGEGVRRDPDDEVRRPGPAAGSRSSPPASG